jgi:hypothetical protein
MPIQMSLFDHQPEAQQTQTRLVAQLCSCGSFSIFIHIYVHIIFIYCQKPVLEIFSSLSWYFFWKENTFNKVPTFISLRKQKYFNQFKCNNSLRPHQCFIAILNSVVKIVPLCWFHKFKFGWVLFCISCSSFIFEFQGLSFDLWTTGSKNIFDWLTSWLCDNFFYYDDPRTIISLFTKKFKGAILPNDL